MTTWRAISGATSETFIPPKTLKGSKLRCKVTAQNPNGHFTVKTKSTNPVRGT